jgi:DNA polymerase-1
MYHLVTDLRGIGKFVSEYQKVDFVSLDTETTGLDCFQDKLILLQIKAGETAFIFDCRKLGEGNTKYVVQLLKDSNKLVLGHNVKFDVKFLFTHTGELLTNVYDTFNSEVVLTNGVGERFPSLASLTKKYLNIILDKTVRNNFVDNPDLELTEEILVYAALDVEYLEKIREFQLAEAERTRQTKVVDLENLLLPVDVSMETNGIPLDAVRWRKLAEKAGREAEALDVQIKTELFTRLELHTCKTIQEAFDLLSIPYKKTKKNLAIITQPLAFEFYKEQLIKEFNLGSNNQLKSALNLLGYKLKSTSNDALNEIENDLDLDSEDDLIEQIQEFRSKKKLASSFGENFIKLINPITGKLHTNFNQLGARSGRFSSGGEGAINLQNIVADPEYRECFIAEPGCKIVGGDFSQEEYRLAGAISKEQEIIKAYKSGADMHVATAAKVNAILMSEVTKIQRNAAKPVNFSILYGTSAYGMSKKQKIKLVEAERIVKAFFDGYPTLAKFMRAFQEAVVTNGYSVTLYGRRRYFEKKVIFSSIKDKEKYYAKVKREGFNHIIQGTGADIVKLALCRLFYENPFGYENFRIILTVHDEIQVMVKDLYVADAKIFIKRVMEEVEQTFLGEIPALADVSYEAYWNH